MEKGAVSTLHEESLPIEAGEKAGINEIADNAKQAAEHEHELTPMQAVRKYPKAIFWCLLISACVIMEGYDTSLLGNFYAYPEFAKRYGKFNEASGNYQLTAPWQAGLSNASGVGSFFGTLLNGYLVHKFGHLRVISGALFFLSCFVFIVFFATNTTVLLVGELLCGFPWGIFATTAPAYASEVLPMALRTYLTSWTNMCFIIGQLMASGVLAGLVNNTTQWSYRIPFALQWLWPVVLGPILFFAPETPWHLVRVGKIEEAKKSLRALRTNPTDEEIQESLNLIIYTNNLEESLSVGTSYWDCFKGFELRRTMRVTRACDRCKKRKIRCTGLQPCRLCIEANASCTYDAAYTRGRHGAMASRRSNRASPPPPPQNEQQHHERQQSESSRWHAANRQSPGVNRQQQQSNGEHPDSYSALGDPTQPGTEPLSRASPEPLQTDLEGHYVGPSSGVSFLLRIQKRLDQFVSFPQGSSIFTFGDAPLPYLDSLQTEAPYFDPTLYMMLSRSDTTRLVQRYFDFAVPVDRFLHQQTIETWLDELYETRRKMHNSEDASTRTAVLFMVFALAQAHMSPRPTSDDADLSVRYFLAAHQLLSREQGAIRLASIQARLLQCLWLLSESRINHCWNLFGTAARLAYAIGLHRKRHADRIDRIEVECRRRTFWSAYALDNYLSMALGRPRTFHDDDIDQELPSCVDDHQIYADHIRQGSTHGQSVMLGPVAYAKCETPFPFALMKANHYIGMSRILSMILRNVYSIHTTSRNDKHAFAIIHTKELVEWRADVAHFLDPVTNMPLIPIFQGQKNVLNLAYWHTMILTHRPFLLRNFAQLQNGSRPRRDDHEFESRIEQSIHECLQAATNITKTVDDMYQGGQLFRAYWFTSYFAFSAAVILYVYTIQKSNESEESYSGYLAAATRCQDQLSNLAEDGSLVARYCLVLEELRLEALRQTKQGQINNARSPTQRQAASMANTGNGTDAFGSTDDGTMVTELGANMTDMGGIGDIYVTPTDSLAEMTGWAQFDAMGSVSMDGFQLNI